MPKPVDEQQAAPEITSANQGRKTDEHSIEYAVSQLLKEPSEEATPVEEPEETAEKEEEVVEETTEETSEEDYEEADTEVEAEASESSESEEEDPEEVEEAEEETEELDYYLIKVDGEEVEVTLDELRSGYQRQKDYTKKTQNLAEQRKEYEDRSAKLEELFENFTHQATLASELLNRDLKKFTTIDWDKLKAEDPVEFVTKQLEVQEVQRQKEQLATQMQMVSEQKQQDYNEKLKQYLESERKETLKLFPDWKDANKKQAAQDAIVMYGKSIGYTDQDLANITRAKDLLLLEKARKYDELQAKKAGITSKKKAPAIRKRVKSKGVAPKTGVHKKSVDAKRQQLRKSGSLRDAAALMHELKQSKVIEKTRG